MLFRSYGVAFSPDGSHLVSVGADKRIQLYDGKTGEVKGQIGEGERRFVEETRPVGGLE